MLKLVERLNTNPAIAVHAITCNDTLLDHSVTATTKKTIDHPGSMRLRATAREIAKHLESISADILHINCESDLLLAAMVKRSCTQPLALVMTQHATMTQRKYNPLLRFAYGQIDLLLVTTQKMLGNAGGKLPLAIQRVSLLPPPIDHFRGERAARTELDIAADRFAIGCLASIAPPMNQHVLLDALKTLRDRSVDCQAVFTGPATHSGYLKKLQSSVESAGLQADVRIIESSEDPVRLMPCFDVIVLPSCTDTFGLVLAEALSMGVAVVGTNNSGAADVIEHGVSGLLVRPGDPTDLANALTRLFRNREMVERLATDGRKIATERFSEETHDNQLIEAFNRLLV